VTITTITSQSHHPQIFERDVPKLLFPATSWSCEQPTVDISNVFEYVFEGGEGGGFMTHWQ